MTERSKRVCAEVCCLQAGRASARYTKDILKMLVEGINETVREALHVHEPTIRDGVH
jgi:hypothetical protein